MGNVDQNIIYYESDKTEIRLPFYRFFWTFWNIFVVLCTQIFNSQAWVRGDVSHLCRKIKSHTAKY